MKQRADGLFQAQITITEKGKKKQKYFYGKSPAELKRKMVAYRGEIQKGRLFSVVAEEWQEEHFKGIANGTKMCYNPSIKRALERFGDTYINNIIPQEVSEFINDFAKQNYSLQTVKTQKLVLNMIFNHGILNGDLLYNATAAVKLPKNLPKGKRLIASEDDIDKVKASINCHFGLFAYLLLYTGCRRGEALALKYEDVNFNDRTITIDKAVYFLNNHPMLKEPKTEAGKRDIILLDKLEEKLNRKGKGLIFSDDKKLLSERQFVNRWKRYCKESGVEITPHQLRHAYATSLFEAGIDEKDAQELLGHANIAVTKDIYTHIRKSRRQKTAESLNDYLNK